MIPENTSIQLPFLGIAGDVVIMEPATAVVSDVFRIFNNVINTGAGTGLGNLAFLYSSDDSALPLPPSYSANAVFVSENTTGITSYVSNGTDFLLGTPEPATLGLLSLALAVMLVLRLKRRGGAAAALAAGILCCVSAFGQTVNLATGRQRVVVQYHLPEGMASAQTQADVNIAASSPGLPFYTNYYTALGSALLPFNILGTDPSLGANTTTIPTVLVPLKFIFPSAGNPILDGSNVVAVTQNSPLFQTAPYTAGTVDLGVTQYGDALQRAEFWNLPGFSPDYHVLLGQPVVAPPITISVPTGTGNIYPLSSGGLMGVVDTAFFERTISALTSSYSANQLPIFLTDNVYLGTSGLLQNCCILGYHASQGPPATTARTWIYTAYVEPGTYAVGGPVDVVPFSHEVAEWLNDPFVGAFEFGFLNFVPPAMSRGGGCAYNFETGDPIQGYIFSKVTNSTTYHLQDEVLLPWYLHTDPSFSVNGWYTFQNLSASVPLVVDSPPALAGSDSNTATLLWAPVDHPVSGQVAYVGRGCPADMPTPGTPEDPYLADPNGKIALIDRGSCGISVKVDRAAKAGAIGVLIGLVAPGNAVSFTYAGGTDFVPSIVITQPASNAIKSPVSPLPVNITLRPVPPPPSTLCGPG